MTYTFESEKNKKALLYTAIICTILLLLFILISWKTTPPSIPNIQELIEVNLGNEMEGMGEEQPLIKGNPTPATPQAQAQASAAENTAADQTNQDESNDNESATVLPNSKKTQSLSLPKTHPNKPIPSLSSPTMGQIKETMGTTQTKTTVISIKEIM